MFNIPLGFKNAVCQQLITCFPVWCIHFSDVDVLVNVCEVLLSPGLLENLLSLHSNKEPPTNTTHKRNRKKRNTSSETANVQSSKPGRPSIVEKFPTVVEIASEFIKTHGYAAHVRRREGVASTPGVSLNNIRHHLLDNVPGLKEHGISVNTIARLMNPPRRKTIAAERYKGLIAARVPGKKNCYREDSPDQHYLFARVAYRRELAARFPDEFAMFSCDDMNKIKVGPLAVSRYHQVERFFPTEDTPNYPDHDFPVPGYHLIPSGYMRIVAPVDVSPSNEYILEPSLNDYTAVDSNNSEVDPQSPQTINLDDSEQSNVPDPCTIIDLTEESDPELQQFVSNDEPVLSHHTLSDSYYCDTNQSHPQASTASTQVRGQIEQYPLIVMVELQLMPDCKDQ